MAAITSSITIPLVTVPVAYRIEAHINVANPNGYDVQLLQIVPRIRETNDPFSRDVVSRCLSVISISQNPTILAGTSNNYLMEIIFHAPSGSGQTYDIGCDIYATDGELVSPTPVTVTVTLPQ